MRNNINIQSIDNTFNYVIEYVNNDNLLNTHTNSADIKWAFSKRSKNCIHLLEDKIQYYKHFNDWYLINDLDFNNQYIPENISTSKMIIYIPNHNISNYISGIKYILSVNTWINGNKIDLGSHVFKPTDTKAINSGILKNGNNEYCECIEFDIIDPFELIYSDKWIEFRKNVCKEPIKINSTGSQLYVTLYCVKEVDNRYMLMSEYAGGMTNFNISKNTDFLKLNINTSLNPLGLKFNLDMNSEYDWILEYLYETYNINTSHSKIKLETVIKSKDSVIIGPSINYNPTITDGKNIQYITYDNLMNIDNIKLFFSTWDAFEEGWNFIGSLIVFDEYDEEIFNVVSNEIPITQEVFSIFINGGAKKIIDLNDMNITQYNVVNKINNEIIHLDRPEDSKSNIIQPVFFRVKDAELLTLHPEVTENICINLDDYKSKVDRFILQIGNCRFDQIGANKYGIIFKVIGKKISGVESGLYYILNENSELVTTGKFNCSK